ncbi:hypothetical protein [Thioalkalivibrio paradoxus]|uniref:Uncharacterized protein n=1 Tax=Thioalkalivibrio paradoxus ARh 1 TaxID=713585 RepID=W0DNA2_9GAMM|nr:hypothetical protein [Thioalkalivibrio paradoxus]AHF00075.1 hypothetical protein THITH_08500 [Thioalkalivibrio paradoxus ARh 1]
MKNLPVMITAGALALVVAPLPVGEGAGKLEHWGDITKKQLGPLGRAD